MANTLSASTLFFSTISGSTIATSSSVLINSLLGNLYTSSVVITSGGSVNVSLSGSGAILSTNFVINGGNYSASFPLGSAFQISNTPSTLGPSTNWNGQYIVTSIAGGGNTTIGATNPANISGAASGTLSTGSISAFTSSINPYFQLYSAYGTSQIPCLNLQNGTPFTSQFISTNGTSIQFNNAYNSSFFTIASQGFPSTGGFPASTFSTNCYLSITSDQQLGTQLVRGATTWSAASDQRMKIQISTLDSALEKVTQLRPVSYLYEKDPLHHPEISFRAGFIAQEVQGVYPDLVNEDSGPAYTNLQGETFHPTMLRMSDMIPYLTRAIQEQQAMIDQLVSTVAGHSVLLS
jgi:hypothetical protein